VRRLPYDSVKVDLTRAPQLRFFASAAILLSIVQAIPLGADGSANLASASTSIATSSLHVAATFAPRSSLHVSTRVLTFHVTSSAPAEASVDIAAGVRLASGTAVELIAEADAPASSRLAVVAGPEGTLLTPLGSATPTVILKWSGSGFRTGPVTLRLNAPPGIYNIPITLRLSTGTAD
jgi:hypothetical protein